MRMKKRNGFVTLGSFATREENIQSFEIGFDAITCDTSYTPPTYGQMITLDMGYIYLNGLYIDGVHASMDNDLGKNVYNMIVGKEFVFQFHYRIMFHTKDGNEKQLFETVKKIMKMPESHVELNDIFHELAQECENFVQDTILDSLSPPSKIKQTTLKDVK